MDLILPIRGIQPKFGPDCYFAETATIIGDVVMGDACSVWFNAVVRGDVNKIRIGHRVNIQDGALLHTTYKKSVIEMGNDISVGHHVIVHGATIGSNVVLGMGSIVMDHSKIGENSIIAAGAVVLENTVVEPGSIYGGIPARRLKSVDLDQTREMIQRISRDYIHYADWYRKGLMEY